MRTLYVNLMNEARRIAARYPQPGFNTTFQPELAASRKVFFSDPFVAAVRDEVKERLSEDFGHGLKHATSVSLDAGALLLIEARTRLADQGDAERLVGLVQIAGLLHDIERGEPDHAAAGANTAAWVLKDHSLTSEERGHVVRAIANHEAFGRNEPLADPAGQLISDALYDADKFRWGPENFTTTIWRMMDVWGISVGEMIERYPEGMMGLEKIKETFRTDIGREYGPEIIDLGLEMGNEIYRFLLGFAARDEAD